MSDIRLEIEMVVAPTEPAMRDELHREVWAVVDERMSRLAEVPASEEILAYYLNFQASDGFGDGSWLATDNRLLYTFGDSAGLCTVEMHACHHWASLTVLDRWDELSGVAARYGAELVLPKVPAGLAVAEGDPAEQLLRAILTGRSETVFFYHFTEEGKESLGYAATTEAPEDNHNLRFYDFNEGILPLSRTSSDRERLARLISSGQCACDVCGNLRYFRDLPRARLQFE
ncbi:hypothetical protein [Streptomyces bobili]|uniref:hypothetical protein n=1 Tax=Streptomyces bobili TaxID=67280 RepID=UPI0037F825F4